MNHTDSITKGVITYKDKDEGLQEDAIYRSYAEEHSLEIEEYTWIIE